MVTCKPLPDVPSTEPVLHNPTTSQPRWVLGVVMIEEVRVGGTRGPGEQVNRRLEGQGTICCLMDETCAKVAKVDKKHCLVHLTPIIQFVRAIHPDAKATNLGNLGAEALTRWNHDCSDGITTSDKWFSCPVLSLFILATHEKKKKNREEDSGWSFLGGRRR